MRDNLQSSQDQDLVDAAGSGRLERVVALLPTARLSAAEWALEAAASFNRPAVVEAILPFVQIPASRETALNLASQAGYVECMRLLLPGTSLAKKVDILNMLCTANHEEAGVLVAQSLTTLAPLHRALSEAARRGNPALVAALLPYHDPRFALDDALRAAIIQRCEKCTRLVAGKYEFFDFVGMMRGRGCVMADFDFALPCVPPDVQEDILKLSKVRELPNARALLQAQALDAAVPQAPAAGKLRL